MPQCSIPGCKTNFIRGLYKLPSNPIRKEEWYSRLLPPNGKVFNISYVCEAHFEPHMWENNGPNGARRLKTHAVPSLTCFNVDKDTMKPLCNGAKADNQTINGYSYYTETNGNKFLMETEESDVDHLTNENEMETETVMEIIYIPDTNGLEMTTYTEEITETSIADELLNVIDLSETENDTLPQNVNQPKTTSNNKRLILPETNINVEFGVPEKSFTANKKLKSEISDKTLSASDCQLVTYTVSQHKTLPKSSINIRSQLKDFDQNVHLETEICESASISSQSVTTTNKQSNLPKAKILKFGLLENDACKEESPIRNKPVLNVRPKTRKTYGVSGKNLNQKQVSAEIHNKRPRGRTPKVRVKSGLLEIDVNAKLADVEIHNKCPRASTPKIRIQSGLLVKDVNLKQVETEMQKKCPRGSTPKIKFKSGVLEKDVNAKQAAVEIHNKCPRGSTPKLGVKSGLLEKDVNPKQVETEMQNKCPRGSTPKIKIKSGVFEKDVNPKQSEAEINNKSPPSAAPRLKIASDLFIKNKNLLDTEISHKPSIDACALPVNSKKLLILPNTNLSGLLKNAENPIINNKFFLSGNPKIKMLSELFKTGQLQLGTKIQGKLKDGCDLLTNGGGLLTSVKADLRINSKLFEKSNAPNKLADIEIHNASVTNACQQLPLNLPHSHDVNADSEVCGVDAQNRQTKFKLYNASPVSNCHSIMDTENKPLHNSSKVTRSLYDDFIDLNTQVKTEIDDVDTTAICDSTLLTTSPPSDTRNGTYHIGLTGNRTHEKVNPLFEKPNNQTIHLSLASISTPYSGFQAIGNNSSKLLATPLRRKNLTLHKKVVNKNKYLTIGNKDIFSRSNLQSSPIGIDSSTATTKSGTTNNRVFETVVDENIQLKDEVREMKKKLKNLRSTNTQLKRQLNVKILGNPQEREDYFLNRVFNKDQVQSLNSSKHITWSDDTIKKAMRLRYFCGYSGYQEILKQGLPFPPLRTLQKKEGAFLDNYLSPNSNGTTEVCDTNTTT